RRAEREAGPEAKSESRGPPPQCSGAPKPERAEPHIDRAPDAARRADALAVVAPGTAADDPEAWIAAREPRRSIRRRTVVGLVPAILNPLPGAAVHVVKPHAFGLNDPTGAVCLRSHGLPQRSQSALPLPRSAPQERRVRAHARPGYPHSASVRSRSSLPVNCESQPTYCLASPQLTSITGISPRPQRSASRGHAAAATHASHASNVTSNLETANGFAMVTSCWGPSLTSRFDSLSGEPMMNFPAGMTIITGQPFAHSLKPEPGFAAFAVSCFTVSTVGSIAMRQRCCATTCWAMAPRSTTSRPARPSRTVRPATSTLPRRTRAKDARSASRQRCGMVQLPHTIGRLL